jgi:hypothetical protein
VGPAFAVVLLLNFLVHPSDWPYHRPSIDVQYRYEYLAVWHTILDGPVTVWIRLCYIHSTWMGSFWRQKRFIRQNPFSWSRMRMNNPIGSCQPVAMMTQNSRRQKLGSSTFKHSSQKTSCCISCVQKRPHCKRRRKNRLRITPNHKVH